MGSMAQFLLYNCDILPPSLFSNILSVFMGKSDKMMHSSGSDTFTVYWFMFTPFIRFFKSLFVTKFLMKCLCQIVMSDFLVVILHELETFWYHMCYSFLFSTTPHNLHLGIKSHQTLCFTYYWYLKLCLGLQLSCSLSLFFKYPFFSHSHVVYPLTWSVSLFNCLCTVLPLQPLQRLWWTFSYSWALFLFFFFCSSKFLCSLIVLSLFQWHHYSLSSATPFSSSSPTTHTLIIHIPCLSLLRGSMWKSGPFSVMSVWKVGMTLLHL